MTFDAAFKMTFSNATFPTLIIALVLALQWFGAQGDVLGDVRQDTFQGDVCEGGKAHDVYVAGPVLTGIRNKIRCVAACQQHESCTSVTFVNKTCALFTSYATPCAKRNTTAQPLAAGGDKPVVLEKVNSNWCSHGGQHINDSCSCASQQYRSDFCQIDVHVYDDCPGSQCQHGGVCQDGWDNYTCQCTERYLGYFCEIDRCSCKNGAICNLTDLSCNCRAGFNGQNCTTDEGPVAILGIWAPMANFHNVGNWGGWDLCPTGSFAAGFQLKLQWSAGLGDDTAVNAIRLLCRYMWDGTYAGSITSAVGPFGGWQGTFHCPEDYWIVAYQFYYEKSASWPAENTGVNGLKVRCQGPGLNGTGATDLQQVVKLTYSRWGSWSPWCPVGTAVCGINSRVQPNQGKNWAGVDRDDTALSTAELQCCEY